MSKKNLQFVPDPHVPRVLGLSQDEEARALKLADIALHNPAPPEPIQATGTRAKGEHQRLMQQLQRAAGKVRSLKRAA